MEEGQKLRRRGQAYPQPLLMAHGFESPLPGVPGGSWIQYQYQHIVQIQRFINNAG